MNEERPFWNPYLAGVFLGLVLLASYLVMGFGLGASGGTTRLAVFLADIFAPATIESNAYFARYVAPGGGIVMADWMTFEVLGVLLGGIVGAYSAGRMRRLGIERGPNISPRTRLAYALIGGILMGVGARIGRGCTSGQALTGGSVLALGSWVFMMAVFAGGYLLAPLPFIRRQWR